MRTLAIVLVLSGSPCLLAGQEPARPDSLHHRPDSLTRTPVRLREVTVTATPTHPESPQTTVTVGRNQIALTPAADPWDLLRQTAGLEVHQQGQGPGFASDASIRGFSSDHSTDLALWVDGVPVNEPVNGHAEGYADWSLLLPLAIRDVEVVKGPTSALFGNFAMAGAINVRTLERASGVLGSVEGGAYGRVDGTVLTGLDREGTGAVVAIRGAREGGWRPHSGWELGQLHGRLVRQLAPSVTLDAGVGLYASGWDSPGFVTVDQFDRREFDVAVDPTDGGFKRRAQERVSLRVVGGENLLWRSTLYATQGRWQLFLNIPPEPGAGEGTGSQTEEEDTRHGFGLTSALTWIHSRIELTAGAEGRLDFADYENWFTTRRVRDSAQTLVTARQTSGALFVQSTADLGHHFRLSLGGRYDLLGTRSDLPGEGRSSDTHGVFSPKLGALYHIPGFGAVYANVSRGFRSTDGVITDPSLPLITEWAYEAGLKLDLGPIRAGAAVFRMDVSNEQSFNPITLTTTSGGRSRRDGIDFELEARATPAVRLRADWTVLDAEYRDLVTEDGEDLAGRRVFNTAKYVGSASVELAPPRAPWTVRVGTNVVGPYAPFDEPGVELPPYALLHLAGQVRVGRSVLRLGVRNLLDRMYPELRAGGLIAPGQPRSIYGGLEYGF